VETKDKHGNLPLTVALLTGASTDVIKMLFEAYPMAVEVQNNYGNLPLHAAVGAKAPSDVIKMLYEAFPLAAQVTNIDGKTPLDLAASRGISCCLLQLFNDENKKGMKDLHDKEKVQESLEMQHLAAEVKCLRAEMQHIRSSIANMKHDITCDLKLMIRSLMDEIQNKP
jgi:hypothetical protein